MPSYTFWVPNGIGTITCTADNKKEAAKIAKRFKGSRDVRRVIHYKLCPQCDSRPCAAGCKDRP